MPKKMTAALFQKKLLAWFDQHGRKTLPWQVDKTPYRVWVSEIMLQQTQVSTATPYFERFMHRFTDLNELANAETDEVLHLWAGLGYYSRARNLHRAAKMVREKHDGHFPDTLDELVMLPGIGPSTAGAILSIAFEKPTAILDGNVKRVLTRLHGITQPPSDKAVEAQLWQIASEYTPKKRVADYTQAIMDLGATLCTRSKADCEHCPMRGYCAAYQQDLVASIPARKNRRPLPTRQATLMIVQSKDEVLLQKRDHQGVWQDLWSLPEISDKPDDERIRLFCRLQLQISPSHWQILPSFRHTFSHYHLEIHPVLIKLKQKTRHIMEDKQQIWYNLNQPQAIGLPKPVQRIINDLE